MWNAFVWNPAFIGDQLESAFEYSAVDESIEAESIVEGN